MWFNTVLVLKSFLPCINILFLYHMIAIPLEQNRRCQLTQSLICNIQTTYSNNLGHCLRVINTYRRNTIYSMQTVQNSFTTVWCRVIVYTKSYFWTNFFRSILLLFSVFSSIPFVLFLLNIPNSYFIIWLQFFSILASRFFLSSFVSHMHYSCLHQTVFFFL